MPKIVVLDAYAANPGDLSWEALAELGELTLYDRTAPSEVDERIQHADIVLSNKVVVNKTSIEQAQNLKYIGVIASGVNNIDLAAATEKGIVVCNVPGYSGQSVAQQVLAMILDHANRISEHSISVRKGDWSRGPDFSYTVATIMELEGKTLGVYGYGDIGSRIAQMALPFGMKVLVHKRTPPSNLPDGVSYTDAETLFKESDFISLNCPLTEATQNLICKTTLDMMKPTSVLINTGRGPLIHEEDLRDALVAKNIAAAYLDVLSAEPPALSHPLLGAPNCKITPHIAWSTPEARERLIDITTSNVQAFLQNQTQNKVN